MALKDLVIPTVDVKIADGSFAVRGLSSSDIEKLLATHGNEIRKLWDEFLDDGTDLTKIKATELFPLLMKIVQRLPDAVVDIIGAAADADEEDRSVLVKLPTRSHVDALSAVLGLTMGTDGDWSKILETAMKVISGANGAVEQLVQNQAKG